MTTLTIEMLHEFAEAKANQPKRRLDDAECTYYYSFLSDSHINNLIFPESLDLSDHYAIESVFENVVFLNIDFSNSNMRGSTFKQCQFINVRMIDTMCYESKILDCVFFNCEIVDLLLSNAIVKQTIFNKCRLAWVGFYDSTLENSVFWNNTIKGKFKELVKNKEGIHWIDNAEI